MKTLVSRLLFGLMLTLGYSASAQIMTCNIDVDEVWICPEDLVEALVTRTNPTNNAASLNGTTDYVSLAHAPAYNVGAGDFSVELWVQTTAVGATKTLASKINATSLTGWALSMTSTGAVSFVVGDGTGIDALTGALSTINDGNWHHVAATFDRTSGDATLYVDGGFEATKTMTVTGSLDNTGDIVLGYGIDATLTPQYLGGAVDEFRLWNGVRTSGDISAYQYAHLNPTAFADLKSNLDFNEAVGMQWTDCVQGTTAVSNGAASVYVSGGPANMTFNFASTWVNTSGISQTGNLFSKTFVADDTVVVSVGYCKYVCTDTLIVNVMDCDTTADPRDVAAVYAPTAFTPNGDTKNDYYIVKANAISYFDMQIYNRMGNHLFHSRDITVGWDGTFNGLECKEGTYVVQIIYRDMEGNEFVIHRYFSLYR